MSPLIWGYFCGVVQGQVYPLEATALGLLPKQWNSWDGRKDILIS